MENWRCFYSKLMTLHEVAWSVWSLIKSSELPDDCAECIGKYLAEYLSKNITYIAEELFIFGCWFLHCKPYPAKVFPTNQDMPVPPVTGCATATVILH